MHHGCPCVLLLSRWHDLNVIRYQQKCISQMFDTDFWELVMNETLIEMSFKGILFSEQNALHLYEMNIL